MARVSRQVHTDKKKKRTFADTGEEYKKKDLYKKKKKKEERKPVDITTPKQQEINRQTLEKSQREEDTIQMLAKKREPISKLKLAGVVGAGAVAGVAIGASLPVTAPIVVSAATMQIVRNRFLTQGLSKAATITVKGTKHLISDISGKAIPHAASYATNVKSISLTKKLFIAAGISFAAASIAKDLLGTYPFASFGKEETLQSISFTMTQAINAGLYEEAQGILNASNEIVNAVPTLADKIPYANVQKEFVRYAKQQRINNEVWQKIIDAKIAELKGEKETEFARERRLSDEAAFERKKEYGEEESQRYAQIEEESKARSLEKMRWKSEYYALIREGKFEEADELLESQS